MNTTQSQEQAHKQVKDLITDIYHILYEDKGVLIPPSKEHGIFKFAGASTQAQGQLTKISKKRDSNRPGLGFVIRRADFPDYLRLSIDVEISPEVSGKDPQTVYYTVLNYLDIEYPMALPPLITYSQPAYSGKRGWASKTFIGFEVELTENDFDNLPKTKKRLLDQILKLFYALDYALTEL